MAGNHAAVFRVPRQSAFLRGISLNAPDPSEVLDQSNDTPQIECFHAEHQFKSEDVGTAVQSTALRASVDQTDARNDMV
jgi:hypothetical protein